MTKIEELNKAVPLNSGWSGCYLTDVEKVAIAALALGTTSPEAIKDLTGVKKRKVKWIIGELIECSDWNVAVTLESQNASVQGNFLDSQLVYPILRMKGVVQCG